MFSENPKEEGQQLSTVSGGSLHKALGIAELNSPQCLAYVVQITAAVLGVKMICTSGYSKAHL